MRAFSLLAVVLIFVATALGQTNKGGISGSVTDANGAAVPGASVTITNIGTNEASTVTTSDEGNFSVRSLEPVSYSITVEAPNFKKALVEEVKVDTASVATVNVALEAGNIGEQVVIEADTPLLNTESGTTGQTITERQLQDVPLANRSVLDLASTVANVAGDAGSEDADVTSGQPVPGFNLSLNGGRPGSTAILADGVNNTGVGLARAVVSFTPETVQEFTVQTSAYSAEFGQTGGGTINVTTKSGTNDFNGTALVYHRNPELNARRFITGTGPRNPNNLRYTQVSVSAGGPVFLPAFNEGGPTLYDGRNKTFFFFAYEPRFRTDFITATTLVPTLAEQAGDFRNLTRTNSGWLPTSVAARFNQNSTGSATIYQQFLRNANGSFSPIALPANIAATPTTAGVTYQFCQFGYTGANRVVINNVPQSYCFNRAALGANPASNYVIDPNLNVLPQEFIDPTSRSLLQYLQPSGDYFIDGDGTIKNSVIERSVRQDETRYTLRLDHSITENNKANFRYTLTPAIGIRGFGSDVNGNSAAYSDASQYLLADNHIFTPNIVNDLRLNYTRGVFSEDFSPEYSINGGRNLATELGLSSLTSGGIPLFQISSDMGYNAFSNIGSSGSTNNFNKEERYNLNDIVYFNQGNKTWKFGVDISRAKLKVTPFFGASGGRYDFRSVQTSLDRTAITANAGARGGNPFASFLLGTPNVVLIRPVLQEYNYRWDSGAAFVQNDWKVSQNLTLNLGMRYSLQLPRIEENNLQGVLRPDLSQNRTLTQAQRVATAIGLGFLPANAPVTSVVPASVPTTVLVPAFAFAGQGGRSRYIVPADYYNFEPRFGFAYAPKFFKYGERTNMVIRGGYGISHAPITGNNRSPNPDFGATNDASTTATGSTGAVNAAQPIRLSTNVPTYSGQSILAGLGADANGLVFDKSLGIGAFADVSGGGSKQIPYSQNWNLSVSFEPFKSTVVEVAYVGNKGTNLYLPLINLNPRDNDFVESLETQNLAADNAFNDPLGRTNLSGSIIQIQRGSVGTQFFGFNNLNSFFNPSANSIRHAGYVSVQRRVRNGLTFTANYTFGKSIDDASDASPETRTITSQGQTLGQVSYGAPRTSDRAVSTFDIKHNVSSTFLYDLPFGRGKQFLGNVPGALDAIVGGFTVSGVVRLQGGNPFLPFITDTNRLGGTNRTVRPNVISGVAIKNPLFDPNCPIGSLCEPYINPAAFVRPPRGSLGNAPRTIDVRGPLQKYFDFSIQKNFAMPFIGNEGKRRIQLRVDLLNAFNRSNFRIANQSGTAGFTTLPGEGTLSAAELTAYQAANPGTPVTIASVTALINANRAGGVATGALPLNFFSVPVPEGFATRNVNSYDLRTIEGFKLYRLRGAYDPSFGNLREVNNPRYIQIGLKIYF